MDSKDNDESNKGMKSFHHIENQEKIDILNKVADKKKMPPYAVEKDWWVTQTLRILFDMEVGKHIVFKGGTSLSKGWNLIERFSEDIDLAIDRSFLDFSKDLSRTQITKLREETHEYVTTNLFKELQEKFAENGLDGVKFQTEKAKESDQDPTIIEIYYPNVIDSPGYIQNRVQIEMGCRSLKEPFQNLKIKSLIDEFLPDTPFTIPPFDVPTVLPTRTLLEKIFLLHEEFQKPKEKIRVDRLSRHLYDVFQLSKTTHAQDALKDKDLYETIVKHRHKFTRISRVDYNKHQRTELSPYPTEEFIDGWKSDYATMQEQMIYGESPLYDDMINSIKEFVDELKSVEWKMDTEFPISGA